MLSSMTAASTSELACQTPAGMQAINNSKQIPHAHSHIFNPAHTQPPLPCCQHWHAQRQFLETVWPSCCSTHTNHGHEHHSAYPVCNNHAPHPLLLPAQVGVCPVRRPQSSTAGIHAAAITPTPCKNKFLSSQSPPVETKSTARSGRSSHHGHTTAVPRV
jgi:hypothetical protein